MIRPLALAAAAACAVIAWTPLSAQGGRSLDLTVGDVGLSIGDSRRTVGLRLNFRDRYMEEVIGANVTIWYPYDDAGGVVRGLALGLPLTGGRRIDGIGAGLLGVGVEESMRGIALGGVGVGAGGDLRGLAIGGIGTGAGGEINGIALGGIGVGAGESVSGLAIGGIGVGTGGSMTGIAVGGIGTGVGEDATGVLLGGVGVGAGGRIRGLSLAIVGVGSGEGMTGVQAAAGAVGSGGTLRGISLAGLAVGAPRIEGFAAAAAVGAMETRALVLAPAYFRIEKGGRAEGVNISVFNHVRGTQGGLAIGIFNYARTLDGLQIGLLNYAANKSRGTRLLPLLNYARTRR